jgi:asparagine synthase (glutamine-hydrolysing)
MAALLVAIDPAGHAPFSRMVDELRLRPEDRYEEWLDPASGIQMAALFSARSKDSPLFVDERVAVVFDGWLVHPRTPGSCAERVAQAYRRHGASCSRHLEGEFAFGLWDRLQRNFLAACDPVGQRTLAYFTTGETLLASSRAVALLHDARIPRRFDAVYMAHAFCDWWAQPEGTTAFEQIRRIRPGFALSRNDDAGVAERRVDALRVEDPPPDAGEEAHVDRFWDVLGSAVADALEPPGDACLSLSSGLDSVCILHAALDRRGGMDAFSIVVHGANEIDERRGIEALLRERRTVRWHAVDCSEDGGDRVDALPLPDEPVTTSPAFEPAMLRVARAARAGGFERLLDGEGGDELFDLPGRLWDLIAQREWAAAGRYIIERGPRRALLRDLARPRLPEWLRRLWIARDNRLVDPIPRWMSDEFRRSESTREALRQRERWIAYTKTAEALPAVLGVAPTVGSRSVARLHAEAAGIETRSPFFDRRVVELVTTLPARMRVDGAGSKPFLRRALRARAPTAIVTQPKNSDLYFHLQALWLKEKVARLPGATRLSTALQTDALADVASRGELGARTNPTEAAQAWAALSTALWISRLTARFGLELRL